MSQYFEINIFENPVFNFFDSLINSITGLISPERPTSQQNNIPQVY